MASPLSPAKRTTRARVTRRKDQTFNLRLDEADRKRLDVVAEHFAASAATAIRIVIKEKFDALEAERIARRRRPKPAPKPETQK